MGIELHEGFPLRPTTIPVPANCRETKDDAKWRKWKNIEDNPEMKKEESEKSSTDILFL